MKLRSIHIEPADNGFMCTTHNQSDNKEDMYSSKNDEKTVHASTDDLMEHLGKKLGAKSTKEPSEQGMKLAKGAAKAMKKEKD